MTNAARQLRPSILRIASDTLAPHQFAAAAAALVGLATLYCQIYCAIAFQPIHGMAMPLSASLSWAVAAVLPWLICLELCKRSRSWSRSETGQYVVVASLFAGAAALSIVLELGIDQLIGVHQTRPLPMQVAAQMPAAFLIGCLLILGPKAPVDGLSAQPGGTLTNILSRSVDIDWIEAAGNYVEVHEAGRRTLHRLTMRELEQSLDPTRFARVHRSVIINRKAIEGRVLVGGTPAVRLRDGSVVKVGGRYGANLDIAV